MTTPASEVIDFVLPQLDDPIQLAFLAIIVLMMVFTMVAAHVAARPASWERKWDRGTASKDDDLDIEHGSVTDLWHAVATAPEKLAEIMPGLLLVVGLLGTFLSLGIALNHASNILGQSDAMATGMTDLMGMLKGLGTKFKTSTWGIAGFITLRIWSEFFRFEEKRLTWVIGKVKSELRLRDEAAQAAQDAKQLAVLQQIESAGRAIVEGLGAALAASASEQRTLLQAQFADVGNALRGIHEQTRATSEVMASFTEGMTDIVRQMDGAAKGIADGAGQVAVAATGLNKVVDEFGVKFTQVLDDVGTKLDSAIGEMSERSAETLERGAAKLEGATREISAALDTLSGDVRSTMTSVQDSIGEALAIQRKVSISFISSTKALEVNLDAASTATKGLVSPIKNGLTAISESNRKLGEFDDVIRSFGKTLEIQVPILKRIADGLASTTRGQQADELAIPVRHDAALSEEMI